MRRSIPLSLVVVCAALAGGPENVLLVVNKSSAVSRRVGEYYMLRRGIPSRNVCLLEAPERETISRREYDAAGPG